MYPFKRFSLGELKSINASRHKAVGDPLAYTFLVKPYCVLLQKIIPGSVTPNSITWLGFISMTVSFLATMYFDPTLANPHRYLSLLNALCTLIYLSTDSLDGIHARNTNQCSPLGKILDHFVDSAAVFFASISLCSSLRMGYSIVSQALVISLMLGFYITELSERYTGYLKFSLISGACEGLLGIICIHAISFFNPGLIKTALHSGYYLSRVSVAKFFLAWAVFYIFHMLTGLLRDINKQPARKSYRLIAADILRPILIVLMIIPCFKAGPPKDCFMAFSYMAIYGNSFSLCYLEDYIASMSKMPTDHNVFIYSFLILGIQSLVYVSGKNAVVISRLLLFTSTAHFLIRSGSVLQNLARTLNTKLFTSKF